MAKLSLPVGSLRQVDFRWLYLEWLIAGEPRAVNGVQATIGCLTLPTSAAIKVLQRKNLLCFPLELEVRTYRGGVVRQEKVLWIALSGRRFRCLMLTVTRISLWMTIA